MQEGPCPRTVRTTGAAVFGHRHPTAVRGRSTVATTVPLNREKIGR
jgi:hypothetical protein